MASIQKNQKEIVIVVKEGCGFCSQARMLCGANNLSAAFHDKDSKEGKLWAAKAPKSYSTWPRIFVDNVFLGGAKQLREVLHSKDMI